MKKEKKEPEWVILQNLLFEHITEVRNEKQMTEDKSRKFKKW